MLSNLRRVSRLPGHCRTSPAISHAAKSRAGDQMDQMGAPCRVRVEVTSSSVLANSSILNRNATKDANVDDCNIGRQRVVLAFLLTAA